MLNPLGCQAGPFPPAPGTPGVPSHRSAGNSFPGGVEPWKTSAQHSNPSPTAFSGQSSTTCALLFIAVGFSAERRLGPTMDKVMNKLVVLAEKHEGSGTNSQVPPPAGPRGSS